MIPKSQYSRQPSHSSLQTASPHKSPGRQARPSRRSSPEALRTAYQSNSGTNSSVTVTPDAETALSAASSNDYFGTAVIDHSRGSNKYGQQVEGIALQFTPAHARQRRPDQSKMGNGLYQATNSSHISLQKKPSHGRRRDRSANSTRDAAAGGSLSSIKSEQSRRSGHRSPTQKNMLSQALAKANQAVLLDNAQNIQGAIEAYVEACDILEQVMMRSSDPDDRKKLSAIRATYSTRIAELYDLDNSFDYLRTDKQLPDAPPTSRYLDGQDRISFEDPEDVQPTVLLTDAATPMQLPLRQESLLPQIFGGDSYMELHHQGTAPPPPPAVGNLHAPMDAKFMPQPLSPRRLPSPAQTDDQPTPVATSNTLLVHNPSQDTESTSWLDTFDESHSSHPSSRMSSVDFGKRDQELVSAIEAELDAAVDAAYEDDDFEAEGTPRPAEATAVTGAAPRQPFQPPNFDRRPALASQTQQDDVMSDLHHDHSTYWVDEGADEEELFELMRQEGLLDRATHKPGAIFAPPRQSDSSGVSARSSGRTWESSSTTATHGVALSTLAESPERSSHEPPEQLQEIEEATVPPRETQVLSRKQASPLPPLPSSEKPVTLPLRDRRLSGQSAKQLKIETFARRASVSQQALPPPAPLVELPVAAAPDPHPGIPRSTSGTNLSLHALPATPLASVHSAESSDSPDTPGLVHLLPNSTAGEEAPSPGHSDAPKMPLSIRKKTSSSNLRPRDLSLTTRDLDDLPATPGSALFPTHSRTGTVSTPAVPSASPNVLSSTAVGGMYVFESITDVARPMSPRSPDAWRAEPVPLEPCPESFLLRPFWLMRCLYQTLAHPRGGYLSTKLFVPRDIWRVKGVKIKAMDDKIGQCDVLTAALLKLAKVDTLDADAVLEELQSFDNIIDQVRQNLAKKLGSDVGLTGSTMTAMKHPPAGEDQDAPASKSATSMKSLASSWKKLRSKSSSTALNPPVPRKDSGSGPDLQLASLPMTSNGAVTTSRSYKQQRHPPPTPTGMPHIPVQHAHYMSSLARLFDAVQVLDSIARQVEDPGLKATNKTQVGLELSIRGAAEFFSFFIIRFALADIGVFMDKYLKKNSEWVTI